MDIPSINNSTPNTRIIVATPPVNPGQGSTEASPEPPPPTDVPLLGQKATPPVAGATDAGADADAKKLDKEKLKGAIDSANDSLKNLQNKSSALEFSMDHELGRVIVRLVDTETKEVIRQYPPEEVLEIARQMDKLVGKLLKEKA